MKKIIIFVALVFLSGCGKDYPVNKVIYDLTLSLHTIPADGSTSVDISVTLDKNASADQRNIIFTASSGTLVGATNGSLTVKADFDSARLIATATLKAPASPGKIFITAAPASTSPNGNYTVKDSITATAVIPSSIDLTASSFGIGSIFSTIDTLTGSLRAAGNKKVSMGAKVLFEDQLTDFSPAAGRFRQDTLSSDGNSQVQALYSAPNRAVGTNLLLIATILDASNAKTKIADTVLLTINQ